jgi:hypothetical protein
MYNVRMCGLIFYVLISQRTDSMNPEVWLDCSNSDLEIDTLDK